MPRPTKEETEVVHDLLEDLGFSLPDPEDEFGYESLVLGYEEVEAALHSAYRAGKGIRE